jgi:SAM-dependent methyltransferase
LSEAATVNLANEYRRQFCWRDWPTALAALPALSGTTVLDLGCAVGDVAAELVARGARVIGIDADEQLLREARSRGLSQAEFRAGDLRTDLGLDSPVDGIWCSFTAAFFPDLPDVLRSWKRHLKPRGWLAVTEVDDLFGHEPLAVQTRALLTAYADEALAAGRYDFLMGRKLEHHVRHAGFRVAKTFQLADRELSFNGRAQPQVLQAWRERFARMTLLRRFCGTQARAVEADFLQCLERDDHRSLATVCCCVAGKLAHAE